MIILSALMLAVAVSGGLRLSHSYSVAFTQCFLVVGVLGSSLVRKGTTAAAITTL